MYRFCAVFIFMLVFLLTPTYTNAEELIENTVLDVPTDKAWMITFSSFVSEESLKGTITITAEDGTTFKPSFEVGSDKTKVKVLPPKNGYEKGKKYTLEISSEASTIFNEKLKKSFKKSFIIEEEEIYNIQLNNHVKDAEGINLAEGQTYLLYGEPNQPAETYVVTNSNLQVGDVFHIEASEQLPTGAIRKITAIKMIDGQQIAETVIPTLDEAFAEFEINATYPFTNKNVVAMLPGNNVSVLGDENGWEFTPLKDFATIEGQVYGITGSINFENVNIHLDFDKNNLKNGTHYTALTGTMHANMSIKPEIGISLGKKYLELKSTDVDLGKFTYVLPYGFTIQLHVGVVLKPSLLLGANISYTNSTDFMLGAIYQNESFETIEDFSTRTDKASSIHGGVQVKLGPRLTVEAGYATVAAINLHQDLGMYANVEKHESLNSTNSCVSREIGAFYDLTFEIPALKPITYFNKYSPVQKKLPLLQKDDCKIISKIAFDKSEIELEESKPQNIKVNAIVKDIVSAETESVDVTNEVLYTVSDSRVLISPTGNIYVDEIDQPFTAVVKATYMQDGKPFEASTNISVKNASNLETWQKAVNGIWRGTYRANQGLTGLTLTINGEDALFEFGPVLENPYVPTGSYRAKLKYDSATNSVQIDGEQWINQPATYEFVTLKGFLPTNNSFSGQVISIGSTIFDFSLQKVTTNEIVSLEDLKGTWKGTYVANQGITALTLTIDGASAQFEFGPHSSNPSVPYGSNIASVTINPHTGLITIKGEKWIERPSGYNFATRHGMLNGNILSGFLDGNKNHPFTLEKQ